MQDKPALKTWDNKFSLQWNLLQDLIAEESMETLDSVIDCWFAILFAASLPLDPAIITVTFLPTVCSSMLNWHDSDLFEEMVATLYREMIVGNYWHLLNVLYFPLCIPLDDINHWILLRVLIANTKSQIEVYDSLGDNLTSEDKQVCWK